MTPSTLELTSRSPVARRVYWTVGTIFAGVGIAGVVLPLVPGMPFLIIATWCYARASVRFYNWLLNNRYVGPTLQVWRQHRRMQPLKSGRLHLQRHQRGSGHLRDRLERARPFAAIDGFVFRLAWIGLGLVVMAIVLWIPTYDDRAAVPPLEDEDVERAA